MALNRGYEYRDRIDPGWSGASVLIYLSKRYRHSSEALWEDRLQRGEIVIGGTVARPDSILMAGQWLTWRRPPWDEPDVPLEYALLYEEESILAVAKPCGLPTMPAGGFLEHTLFTLVRKRNPTASPVHRLGRGTSGIVLFACTQQARSRICADFREHKITKVYRALARGSPTDARFTITTPIGPISHPTIGLVHAASAAGKSARSDIRVIEQRAEAFLAEVHIQTGKPHQIRIHLAAAGHPLVGDPLYAPGGQPIDGDALPGAIGYRLHAERLMLRHPDSGAILDIQCSPPPDLRSSAERRTPSACQQPRPV